MWGTVICSLLFEATIYRGDCKRGELNSQFTWNSIVIRFRSAAVLFVIPISINWFVIFINPSVDVGLNGTLLSFKVDSDSCDC